MARQLDDFYHQAEDRDDERRDAEYQCYDCISPYSNHLLTAVRLTDRGVGLGCTGALDHQHFEGGSKKARISRACEHVSM